jgi:hypothetical protein
MPNIKTFQPKQNITEQNITGRIHSKDTLQQWFHCKQRHKSTVTTKTAVFGDVTSCGSGKNRRFGEMYRLHHQGGKKNSAIRTLAVTSN